MKSILFILFISISISALGQKQIDVYTDKSSLLLNEEILLHHQFLDSIFTQGTIYFISGKSAAALMNYNLLDNGISVVDNSKNVLLLDGLDEILFVSYNKKVFFPYLGSFLEQIDTYKNNISLLIKRKTTVRNDTPSDAFGMNSESASFGRNTSASGVGNRQSNMNDVVDIKVEINVEYDYYLKINEMYHSINRIKDLKKLFPNKKDCILSYISDNQLNVNKLDDLKQIIRYCVEDSN
jgi:hypothetical protein